MTTRIGAGYSGYQLSDNVSRGMLVVNLAEHKVHDGEHFFIQDYTTLGDGGTLDFSIETPNSVEWIHMLFEIDGTKATTIDVYEGGTATGGTAVTAYNNNRNSSGTSSATILANPTWNGGTKIIGVKFGTSGSPLASGGGSARRENELILKQNTTYLWRIVSGASDNDIGYRGEWFEHVSGED